MENPKIKPEIAPFKRLCMSIGAIPTSFQDSMDYYECVLWLIKYLENTIIPVVNNNGEAVAELQELYSTLKNYVENYFENLDVQDEINNKLDEMVEDGTLTDIIGDYIEVAKKSYLIEEITTEDIYVENNKGNVHITTIPNHDANNELIKIKHGFAHDSVNTIGGENPVEFSYRNNNTFTSNAGIFATTSSTAYIQVGEILGLFIHDGVVVKDNRQYLETSFLKNRWILGIKPDNTLKAYIGTTDSTTILNDGVTETTQAFIPLMIDGVNYKSALQTLGVTYWSDTTFTQTADQTPVYNKIYYTLNDTVYTGHYHLNQFTNGITYYEEQTTGDQRYQRQVIAQKDNGDIIFITNNGKGKSADIGMSLNDLLTIAKYYDCTFAFVLDGGGSVASIYRNEMINFPTDDSTKMSEYENGMGYTIRNVPDFLYFNKEIQSDHDSEINNIYLKLQELNKKINDYKLTNDQRFEAATNFYGDPTQQHVFNFNQWDNTTGEFIRKMAVYFNNSGSFPHGISVQDIENNTQILRIYDELAQNKGIYYLGKQLATIVNNITQPTASELASLNLNNIPLTFVVYQLSRSSNLDNQPYTSADTGANAYFLMQWGGTYYRFQIAISIQATPIIRVRIKNDSGWQAWKTISVS